MKNKGVNLTHRSVSYDSNSRCAKFILGNLKNIFVFSIISPDWDGTGCWNSSSWKIKTWFSCIFKIMVADDLATHQHQHPWYWCSYYGFSTTTVNPSICSINWRLIFNLAIHHFCPEKIFDLEYHHIVDTNPHLSWWLFLWFGWSSIRSY